MQTDLFSRSPNYPDEPGHRNTDTSREAAASVQYDAETLRAAALDVVRRVGARGMTADETAEYLGQSILSIRPRFSELNKTGAIRDSGQRRKNGSGRNAIVWVQA